MAFPYYSIADTEARVAVGLESDDSSQDTLLERKLKQAVSKCENLAGGRVFYVADNTDKLFRAPSIDGLYLWLNRLDLISINSVTNGDSDDTSISTSDLVLIPENEGPPYDVIWWPDGDGWEIADETKYITVNGKWGYSAALPADVKEAILSLLEFYYNIAKSEATEIVTLPNGTVISRRRAFPQDVLDIMRSYRRLL